MENKFVKNGKCTVKIEDIGNDGEGIGRADGYTLFVKDAVIGDTVEAQIVKPKKNYAFARLSKVIVPSEDRIEPPCPVYRQCGGCQIQAVSYKAQLEFKTKKVRGNLQRIGGFAPELLEQVTEPMIGMDDPWRYRNKAQYPIGTDRNGMPTAGFYAGRTHDIIAEDDCLIGAEENKRILDVILKHMQTCRIKAYDETERTGLLRHVLIRNGRTSGEFMVCLIINRKITSAGTEYIPGQQELVRMLTEAVPEIKSISLNSNTEFTNVILGQTTVTIHVETVVLMSRVEGK
jgi:23S rRNA (uracil1939-C5)-methyltransferase